MYSVQIASNRLVKQYLKKDKNEGKGKRFLLAAK